MFGYIKGIVTEMFLDYVIIENAGVGFKLTTSQFTNRELKHGEEAKLYTKMLVREDDISLLGFYDRSEMKMFELLTSVTKVGPKAGFSMLSTYCVNDLQGMIASADIGAISKASGIGKKTAERIVLELKDKVDKTKITVQPNIYNIIEANLDEAVEVLLSLGFGRSEAIQAVENGKATNPGADTNELIKLALGKLSKV